MRSLLDRKRRARRITARKRQAAGGLHALIRRTIRAEVALWRSFDRLVRESPNGRVSTSPRVTAWFPVR